MKDPESECKHKGFESHCQWCDIFQTSCLLLVEMVVVEMVRNRSYTRHQVVAMEEDMTTEFKGHRSILMEDENPKHWNPNNVRSHGRTRQPWSKYMAGFLNSGMGGTIYGGILDNGSVAGIALSPYQVAGVTVLFTVVVREFVGIIQCLGGACEKCS